VDIDPGRANRHTSQSEVRSALYWLCLLSQNISECGACRHLQTTTTKYSFCLGNWNCTLPWKYIITGGEKSFFEQKPALKALKPEITA